MPTMPARQRAFLLARLRVANAFSISLRGSVNTL
jgi:hypothetical protein